MSPGPTPGGIATGWSTPSTATSPTTSSPAFRSPATPLQARGARTPSRRPASSIAGAPTTRSARPSRARRLRAIVRADELEDIIATVGQTFLGLTVNCARCHDHKFDPIRQAEYYRFASALDGVRAGCPRPQSDTEPSITPTPSRPREAGVMKVHLRGNPNTPGEVVSAGGIAAVVGPRQRFRAPARRPPGGAAETTRGAGSPAGKTRCSPGSRSTGSGRRISAQGLVETPSDLGFNGGVPSHPGVARLAGLGAGRAGLEPEGDPSIDRHLGRLSPGVPGSTRQAMAKDAGDRLALAEGPKSA